MNARWRVLLGTLLLAFGLAAAPWLRAQDVQPVPALSARVIIKDVFGITLTGGWNTGFYFGGSLNYFFGKQFQTDRSTGPAPAK